MILHLRPINFFGVALVENLLLGGCFVFRCFLDYAAPIRSGSFITLRYYYWLRLIMKDPGWPLRQHQQYRVHSKVSM